MPGPGEHARMPDASYLDTLQSSVALQMALHCTEEWTRTTASYWTQTSCLQAQQTSLQACRSPCRSVHEAWLCMAQTTRPSAHLTVAVQAWRKARRRGIWLKLLVADVQLIQPAMEAGACSGCAAIAAAAPTGLTQLRPASQWGDLSASRIRAAPC